MTPLASPPSPRTSSLRPSLRQQPRAWRHGSAVGSARVHQPGSTDARVCQHSGTHLRRAVQHQPGFAAVANRCPADRCQRHQNTMDRFRPAQNRKCARRARPALLSGRANQLNQPQRHTIMNATASLLCATAIAGVLTAVPLPVLAQDYNQSEWNHFGLDFRMGFNIQAKFMNAGFMAPRPGSMGRRLENPAPSGRCAERPCCPTCISIATPAAPPPWPTLRAH
jgi:hypothetical protein